MKIRVLFVVTIFALVFGINRIAFAKEKQRSGTYQTRKNSGTYQQKISRQSNKSNITTTWQNQSGNAGSRDAVRKWNADKGTFSFSSSTTLAGGEKIKSEREITRNKDGSFSIESKYSTSSGKSISIERTVQKLGNGIYSTGTYKTGSGKSGAFQTSASVSDNSIVKTQTLVNQDNKIITHTAGIEVDNGALNRTDILVGPGGNKAILFTNATAAMTDQGLSITGDYNTISGKSGAFQSIRSIDSNGKLVTEQSLTNTQGDTIKRNAVTTLKTGEFFQDVTITGPRGNTDTFKRGFTVNNLSSKD